MDDTSDFMAEVKYWRNKCDVVSLPLEPLSTSVFVLGDLMPGSVYWYKIRVTENSSGAQIGDSVTGQFTAMRPPTFPPIATPIPTPTSRPTATPNATPTASTSAGAHVIVHVFVVHFVCTIGPVYPIDQSSVWHDGLCDVLV